MNVSLEGQTAMVAGGGRGNGAAIAKALAAAGAFTVVGDIDTGRAELTAAEIREAGGEALGLEADLRSDDEVRRLVRDAHDARGRLDVIVNNAGGMSAFAEFEPMIECSDESWDQIVELNLRYVFLVCRAAIPLMRAQGGAIVNVSSMSGVTSSPRHAAYGAAKAGIVNLTRSLAAEYGHDGIRVNAVAPGVIFTEANRRILPQVEVDALSAAIPLGRVGSPEDVAGAVLLLASELARYVSGQTLLVDGGITATYPIAIAAVTG